MSNETNPKDVKTRLLGLMRARTSIVGLALGVMVGAAGVAVGMNLLSGNTITGGYNGANLVKVADITPVKPPLGAPMSFAPIIERVSPAVVSIEVRGKIKVPRGAAPNLPGFDFGDEAGKGKDEERDFGSSGSGFFISSDGYIVTNNHVVDQATEIKVKLTNEKVLKAKVVGKDAPTDIAVLKVEGTNFPFVQFEMKNKPRVGDWVIAVGNPFGLSGTATAGIVSAFGRRDGGQGFVDYMQLDAPINPGNSGGPTFDLYGRVIGVNVAITSPTGGSVGIGYAIPAEIASSIAKKLIDAGKVERGYMGVVIGSVTEEIAEALNIKDLTGAYIAEVNKGGPAEKAGVQIGDIVKAVNGVPIKTNTDLTRKIATVKKGEKVNLTIWRNGKLLQLTVISGTRPSEDVLAGLSQEEEEGADPAEAKASNPILGMSLKPITPAMRKLYNLGDDVTGLVVTQVDPTSEVGRMGLSAGDVIVRANNEPVTNRDDIAKIVDSFKTTQRPSLLFIVNHKGRNTTLVVPIKE